MVEKKRECHRLVAFLLKMAQFPSFCQSNPKKAVLGGFCLLKSQDSKIRIFHSRFFSVFSLFFFINVYIDVGMDGLFDHSLPIFIVQNLLRPSLLLIAIIKPNLGFEVRDDVIFSQSGNDCPIILCPVIPHPHCNRDHTVWSIPKKFF